MFPTLLWGEPPYDDCAGGSPEGKLAWRPSQPTLSWLHFLPVAWLDPPCIGCGSFAGIAFGQHLIAQGEEPGQIGIIAETSIDAQQGVLTLPAVEG